VLLRSVPDRIGPVRAAVHYAAATAHARLRGDLYEVVETRFGVRAVVGDVRGKGLGAVETAADVLGAFREAAHQESALEKVAAWLAVSLERALREHPSGPSGPLGTARCDEEFVTLVLIGVREQGVLEVVNCGHPSPYLLGVDAGAQADGAQADGAQGAGAQGPVRALDAPDPEPPLGVLPPCEVCPQVLSVRLQRGDRILLYTDGIIEARDRSGRFYPLPDRLPELSRRTGDERWDGPEAVLARVHADLRRFVGRPLGDDAAMLLIEYRPVGAEPLTDPARRPAAGDPRSASAGSARPAPHRGVRPPRVRGRTAPPAGARDRWADGPDRANRAAAYGG
jgi:hypothetical protein